MSERQLYRLRAPSTGREMLLPAEPEKVYTRPRDGRAARGRREGAPAAPVEVQPAMGGRDPAVLQLVRPARSEGPQRLPHVRPPHGRAAPLRGGRMRLRAVAARRTHVPARPRPRRLRRRPPSPSRSRRASPRQLTVPGTGERRSRPTRPPPPTATATETPDADAPRPRPTPDGRRRRRGRRPDRAGRAPPSGGTEAPAPGPTGTGAAPPAGSDAEEFEDFCAENPGAC